MRFKHCRYDEYEFPCHLSSPAGFKKLRAHRQQPLWKRGLLQSFRQQAESVDAPDDLASNGNQLSEVAEEDYHE